MSAPVPTAAIGGHLVKISASGPMPTSRYCDQTPCPISTSLSRIASGDPGRTSCRLLPITERIERRKPSALRGVAARLLFDHPLEQARHERHAARLDRLQIARRDQPRLIGVAAFWPSPPATLQRADRGRPPASRMAASGSSSASNSLNVAATLDRSWTPSPRTTTGEGPLASGSQARPTSVARPASSGSASAGVSASHDCSACFRPRAPGGSARRRRRCRPRCRR